VKADLTLPVLELLPDGSYSPVLVNPKIRGKARQALIGATELPAALLARLLGIHISVAVAWQRASSGDWTAYAADYSRRQHGPADVDDSAKPGLS
jgi:hypothetical protein